MNTARRRRRRRRAFLLSAMIGAALTAAAGPRAARAACMVGTAGRVNCAAGTVTTATVNLNGAHAFSVNRQQTFDNGAAISAAIQPGVVVSGFGLELTEAAATARPITVNNQGEVTTAQGVDALRIIGNGGAIRYAGDGSVTNTSGRAAGLFVTNVSGDVSLATGAGAISGTIGIGASTTGGGAVTIATGAGLVSGTAGSGVSATTKDGAFNVRIGSGGVTGVEHPGVELTTTDGDISIVANGNVSAFGVPTGKEPNTYGIEAISNGLGNIEVGGSGTTFGQYGRGIYAVESASGLGGILVTGTGDSIGGSPGLGCPRIGFATGCSGIRAWIENPADSSNIVVNRSGNIAADSDPTGLETSAIHAVTAGAGDVVVTTGAGATLTNANLFGVIASAYGRDSTGSIDVSTGANGATYAGGVGIFAYNEASAIPVSAGSTITVTNNGTIDTGAGLNPVNRHFTGGGSGTPTILPVGILAGYNSAPKFGLASGVYSSCGSAGCVTLTPNPDVNGTVIVVNNGAINAGGGYGVFAYNFGNGAVSVTSRAPITVTGATSQDGVKAFSAEVGAITVTTTANVSALNGNGVFAESVGTGTTTIAVLAGVVEGGASGVTAFSRDGAITIFNTGTIQNISGQPGDLAVRTSGSAASLTNGAGGVLTGTVSMTGAGANVFANAGVWNTLGASPFAGSASLANSGVLNALGPTTLLGPATLINSGLVNLTGGAGSPFPTLTTHGYVGAGGVLALNADLGAKGTSGRLVIDGGAATGRTVLIVNAVTGSGAPTSGDGVEVIAAIHGATTAPGAFTLGARVAAGAYQYQLYDGGDAGAGGDPDNQNWYLRSSGFRPEVPLDAAIPTLASRFGLDMLGTYHDRVGEAGVLDAGEAGVLSAGEAGVLGARDAARAADGPIAGEASRMAGWGRLFGETGSGLVGGGPGSGFGLSGFQTGVDLYRHAAPDRSQDAAGLYVGAGAANAAITLPSGGAAGDLSMSGTALGGYWTHRGSSGWYVDAVAQGTRFDNVAANSAAGQGLATSGWGLAASLEGGYPIALGRGVTLEPQAQAIFQRISLRGGQDAYGLVNFADADPLYGRIGARLSRLWTFDNGSAIETWGRANLWRAFGPDASATFSTLSGADPASFGTSLGGTWAQFGLGASSRIARHVAVFAAADCDLAVDGPRGHSYQGRIGVEIAW